MKSGAGYRVLQIALIFVFGVTLGAIYEPVRLFINHQVDSVQAFIKGHPLEAETSIWQKVQNDLGLAPWRATRKPTVSADFPYQTLALNSEIDRILPESSLEIYLDKNSSALRPYAGMLIKTPVNTGRGYSPALLLVGFDGEVHKLIPLATAQTCSCNSTQPLNYFHIAGDPADLHLSGNKLVNINSCGAIDWSVDSRYSFHHYLNNDGDHLQAAFWALDATDLVKIDTESGTVLNRISLSEIINANPDLPIFESRFKGSKSERWIYGKSEFLPIGRTHTEIENADHDPFHTNDIDEYLGQENGLFEKGDLVLSFRSTNLIMVVRPGNRKIIWYAYGLTSRQHDPDFISGNSILVYDNNFHNDSSRVVKLEAAAHQGEPIQFAATRSQVIKEIAGIPFHQLIEGYQFQIGEQALIVSAESYNAGINTETGDVFLALRHSWREQRFLSVDVERVLTPAEFSEIKNANCI